LCAGLNYNHKPIFTLGRPSSHLEDHVLHQDPLCCVGYTHLTWSTNCCQLLLFTALEVHALREEETLLSNPREPN